MSKIKRLDDSNTEHYIKYLETHGLQPTDRRAKMILPSKEDSRNVAGVNTTGIPTFAAPGIKLSDLDNK